MGKQCWSLGLALALVACGNAANTGGKTTDDVSAAKDDLGGFGNLADAAAGIDTGTQDLTPTPDVAADTGAADISIADAEADVPPAPDVPKADGGCTEAGCACTANSNCDSGFCIETGAGKQCAKTCSGTCPEGFGCTAVTGNGGDVVNLCLPAHPRICEPCMADSDCNNVLGGADSRCMPYKDKSGSLLGAYCGGSCDSDHPCPNGYECKEGTSVGGVKSAQCVRADLVCACDGRAVKMELTTTCSNANGLGTCTGTRKCGATGLSSCTAATAQAEAAGVARGIVRAIDKLAIEHAGSAVAAWVTVSIGVASCTPTSEADPTTLMERADEALYVRKKRQGRHGICLADEVAELPTPTPLS